MRMRRRRQHATRRPDATEPSRSRHCGSGLPPWQRAMLERLAAVVTDRVSRLPATAARRRLASRTPPDRHPGATRQDARAREGGRDVRSALLRWLDDPDVDRGIHFADRTGGWSFHSYADLAGSVAESAGRLVDAGVGAGGVVCIAVPSGPEFVAAFFGTLIAGGTPSPVAPPLIFRSADEYVAQLVRQLQAASPSLVVSDADLLPVAVGAVQAAGLACAAAVHRRLQREPAGGPDLLEEPGDAHRGVAPAGALAPGRQRCQLAAALPRHGPDRHVPLLGRSSRAPVAAATRAVPALARVVACVPGPVRRDHDRRPQLRLRLRGQEGHLRGA